MLTLELSGLSPQLLFTYWLNEYFLHFSPWCIIHPKLLRPWSVFGENEPLSLNSFRPPPWIASWRLIFNLFAIYKIPLIILNIYFENQSCKGITQHTCRIDRRMYDLGRFEYFSVISPTTPISLSHLAFSKICVNRILI